VKPKRFKDHIPNFITLLNLISGSIAIVMVFSGKLPLASWFIFLAAVFDFCDGLAARLLHAKSAIGGELDSLADVISFGLAPAVILYQLLLKSPNLPEFTIGSVQLLPFAALLVVACSAYRLAKFNIDPGQATEFKGLPTPATGLFVAALPLIILQAKTTSPLIPLLINSYALLAIIVFLSWLMVSNIPMLSLKFKNLTWKDNYFRFILIGALPVLFIFFRFAAIPLIIFLYIILSIISLSLNKTNS
jgi:CDP-diacylglycerol---serine O-phosphatidyltransferase